MKESEERYRRLFENSRDALVLLDGTGARSIGANRAALDMFRAADLAEFIATPPLEYAPECQPDVHRSRDKAQEIIGALLRDGSHNCEWPHKRGDGTLFYADISLTRIELGGQVSLLATLRDITERKAAEEQLRKLSLAVEQSPESIFICDLSGSIEYVNETFVRATGRSRDEAIGQNPRILGSGKTPPESYRSLWATVTGGRPWTGELYNRRKDGAEYVDFAIITPLRESNGRITHYVAVQVDITERLRLKAELDRHRHHLEELVATRTADLAEATKKAEAANAAKGAFIANVSHEIRTPMNAIVGLTRLLLREEATQKQAERLNTIDIACGHLLNLINDILDLSKIEAERLELERREFALSEVFDYVRAMIAGSAAAKQLSVEVDLGGMPQCLFGDVTRLRQALLNYAVNAVKFTKKGSVAMRVRLLEERDGELLARFEVEDTGIGVEPGMLPRLFQAFEQADVSTTREFGGTGLGLAITRRLAELMGGEAGAQSSLAPVLVHRPSWPGASASRRRSRAPSVRRSGAAAGARRRPRSAGRRQCHQSRGCAGIAPFRRPCRRHRWRRPRSVGEDAGVTIQLDPDGSANAQYGRTGGLAQASEPGRDDANSCDDGQCLRRGQKRLSCGGHERSHW